MSEPLQSSEQLLQSNEQSLDGKADGRGHYAGRCMGGFKLSREIASGGMASVYLAHKVGPGGFTQVAAVKVVHPHLARDREFVDMFLDEARIAARINHPNVCRVFDFGCEDGTYYLAMEHLAGETWSTVCQTVQDRSDPSVAQRLPLLLASVLAQACEGLHAAHEAKDVHGRPLEVVHRDVSPQNTFVTYDGCVRVLDFGIASAAERLHTTRHGTVKGRFSYMSPEQMCGEEVDRRADVWSLGVILWEGLAGERLFRRKTDSETILAVTNDTLPSMPTNANVPPALMAIVNKALQRDPNNRFATAREMGAQLARYVARVGPMGAADVSHTMHTLFSRRITAKEALLAEAAREAEVQPDPAVTELDITVEEPVARPPRGSEQHSVSAVRSTVRNVPVKHGLAIGIGVALAALLTVFLFSGDAAQPPATTTSPTSGTPAARAPTAAATQPPPTPSVPPHYAPQPEPSTAKTTTPPPATVAASTPQPVADTMPPQPPKAELPKNAPKPTVQPSRRKQTAGKATLNITSPGCWATVSDGTRRLGTTPGSFRLDAGDHTLVIAVLGKTPAQRRRVHLDAGRTERIKIPCK